MKLARYSDGADTLWGAVDVDARTIRPIAGAFEEWAPVVTAEGDGAVAFTGDPIALDSVKLLAPVNPASEIMGTGVNYPEWGIHPDFTDSPFYFRPLSAIVGTDDELKFPRIIEAQPWCRYCYEIELIAVLGRPLTDYKHGGRDVLGYTVGNDGCLRGQRPSFVGMDLMGSKCGYHATAIGPWITTKDELAGDETPDLLMTARVNGVVTQQERTGQMIWNMDRILWELGHRTPVGTGDLVFTGTCGYTGVEDGFYEPGDVVEFEIEGLGVLRNTVEAVNPYASAA